MAIVTIISARYVRRMFSCRRYPIVTAVTGAHYVGVVHREDRYPRRRVMAVLARI